MHWALCFEVFEFLKYISSYLVVIFDIFDFGSRLNFNSKFQNLISLVDQLLIAIFNKLELDRDITSIHTLLQALDSSSDVGVSVDQLAIMESLELLLLLVWENDATSESLRHQKVLAEGTRTSSQNIVGVSWDNCAKGENEIMDLHFVEEVSCHCI
jgi:hypothetical protein